MNCASAQIDPDKISDAAPSECWSLVRVDAAVSLSFAAIRVSANEVATSVSGNLQSSLRYFAPHLCLHSATKEKRFGKALRGYHYRTAQICAMRDDA